MADTCIVCLGDLNTADATQANPDVPTTASEPGLDPVSEGHKDIAPNAQQDTDTTSTSSSADEIIAHILPCGHNLHDSCLRPWVERANSCPICRATFNVVELRYTLNGPSFNSYSVQDKTQVPDAENLPIVDDGDNLEDIEPCMICSSFGDDATLLLCDGCNHSCHVFCAGLDNVPAGAWFCYECQSDSQVFSARSRARPRTAHTSHRPARLRRGSDPRATWARVWESVATRVDLDLDFPFEEEEQPTNRQRSAAERREFREWERRFQLAARAAGPNAANRFREIARPIEPQQPQRPDPESQAQIRAWNAMEKARIITEDNEQNGTNANGSSRRRKRKSSTPSPATEDDRPPPAERKRKRPRTSIRVQDAADSDNSRFGESSRAAGAASIAAPRPSRPSRDLGSVSEGPTFLQSLLSEVQAGAAASNHHTPDTDQLRSEYFRPGNERSVSPDGTMPMSPSHSGHGTPRSMTPPPLRPMSPMTLTSNLSPVFPPQPSPPLEGMRAGRPLQRHPYANGARSPASSPTRGPNGHVSPRAHSPNRPTQQLPTHLKSSPVQHTPAPRIVLNLTSKTTLQNMVKHALKPSYHAQNISSEQYTDINKCVSRRLYELVGREEALLGEEERWRAVAEAEVRRELEKLKGAEGSSNENDATSAGAAESAAAAKATEPVEASA